MLRWTRWTLLGLLALVLLAYLMRDQVLARPLARLVEWQLHVQLGGRYRVEAVRGDLLSRIRIEGLRTIQSGNGPLAQLAADSITVDFSLPGLIAGDGIDALEDIDVRGAQVHVVPARGEETTGDAGDPDGSLASLPERLFAQQVPSMRVDGSLYVGDLSLRRFSFAADNQGGRLEAETPQGPVELRLRRSESAITLDGTVPGVIIDRVTLTSDRQGYWMFDADLLMGDARLSAEIEPRSGRIRLAGVDAQVVREVAGIYGVSDEALPESGQLSVTLDGSQRHGDWQWEGKLDARKWAWDGNGIEYLETDFTIGASRLTLSNLALRSRTMIPPVTDGSGAVAFDGKAIRLERFNGMLGGEPLAIEGEASDEGYRLRIQGRNVLLTQKPELRLRADLDLTLLRAEGPMRLEGRVGITNMLYRDPIRLFYLGGEGSVREDHLQLFELPVEPLASMEFDLDVQSGPFAGEQAGTPAIRMYTDVFNGELGLDLHIAGTGALPVPTGAIYINAGIADLPFATYQIERGRVEFTRTSHFDPLLSIVATANQGSYEITLIVTGHLSDPELTASTVPPLPPDESLLLATTGMTRATAEQEGLGDAAGALATYMAKELSRGLFGRGDPSEKGVLDRVSLEVGGLWGEEDVTTGRIEYRLWRRYFLFAERDEYEHYNAGLIWRYVFGQPPPSDETTTRSDPFAGDTVPWEFHGYEQVPGFSLGRIRELVAYDRRNFLEHDFSRAACEDAAYTLRTRMLERGYPDAEVDYAFLGDGDRPRRVVFTFKPGRRWLFGTLRFFGNAAIEDAQLRELLGTAGALGLGARPYSRSALSDYLDRIRRHYVLSGHLEVELIRHELAWREDTGMVDVTVFVREGLRYEVCGSTLETTLSDQALVSRLREQGIPECGTVYHPRLIKIVEARLRGILQDAAHHRPEISVEEDIGEVGLVRLHVSIDPGPRLVLGNLHFTGLRRTRESYLKRLFAIEAGELLDDSKLQKAERRLLSTGIMSRVDTEIVLREHAGEEGAEADGARRVADIAVAVEEGHNRSLDLHLGWGSWERLRGGIRFSDRNFMGRGRYWDVDVIGSVRSFRASSQLRDTDLLAGILGPNQRLRLAADYEYRQEPSFERTVWGAGLSHRQFFGRSYWLEGSYRYEIQEADEVTGGIAGAEEQAIRTSWLGLGGNIDKRNHQLQPTSGWELAGRVRWSIPALGSEIDVVEYDFESAVHFPLIKSATPNRPWLVFSLGGAYVTRDVLGKEDVLPIQERLFLGGANSVRSFDYQELGPVNPSSGDPTGGRTAAHASAEARIRVYGAWHTAVFYDIGVLNEDTWHISGPAGQAVGLGVRWYTPIGPLRVDWAWNPGERFGADDPWAVHGAIGFAF